MTDITSLKSDHETLIDTFKSEIQALERRLAAAREEITALSLENVALKTLASGETLQKNIYLDMLNNSHDKTFSCTNRLIDRAGTINNTGPNNSKTIKTINMGTLDLSRERLEPLRDSFTREHYDRGGAGSADWAVDNILTDESGKLVYRCTDKNRKQFVYRDESGNTVTDVNASRLKNIMLPLMKDKIREYKRIKCMEMAEASDDDSQILDEYNCTHQQHTTLGTEFERRLVQKTYLV